MMVLKKVINQIKKNVLVMIEKILKKNNGEFYSISLRRLYKKYYGMEIGIGTYGCFKQDKYKYIKKIGNYSSIAEGLSFFSRNHPKDYASTHPMFYNSQLGYVKKDTIQHHFLEIGNDVWIGQGVYITNKCVRIGNGAIIGAGSIVTQNVEPYSIVAGNPAREIGKRFTDDVIELLELSEWYLLSPHELEAYVKIVNNPQEFAERIIDAKKRKG